MASQVEVPAPAEFLVSEANGTLSRDAVTLIGSLGVLPAGRILGKITASSKFTNWTSGAADGSQNAAGVLTAETDATAAGDVLKVGIISRYAEVASGRLSTVTPAQLAAGITSLAGVGIIGR